jgi:hypothetical protein
MVVTKHAISRTKKHGLAPKCSSKKRVANYLRNGIKNKCMATYINKKTGAKVYITEEFCAVTKFGIIVTVYPGREAIG